MIDIMAFRQSYKCRKIAEIRWIYNKDCQTGLSILQARDRCDAHTEETRIPKINRTPQIATVADSHMIAERQRGAYHNTDP
jgi:hypothetical protein